MHSLFSNGPSATLSPILILSIVLGYFLVLIAVAWWTSRQADARAFFTANRASPWYLVAFGMIGASLSGVTFISVPGMVGAAYLDPSVGNPPNQAFSYMQMVLGYLVGYAVIAGVLLPLYYRLQLTSIYTYLQQRFGRWSYKTGAAYFLLSRVIGASFRLFLVAMVLHDFVFQAWGVPFWMVALFTIVLIWLYTFRGGIKTIVWTDTLQTLCMLIAVTWTLVVLTQTLDWSWASVWANVQTEGLGQVFFFEGGWTDPNNFWKQFVAGAFIAIVMTGLDQDMMQKNLTCRNLEEAQKNMVSFSLVLVVVNFMFLLLGALLAIYALRQGIVVERSDQLYPTIALQYLPVGVGLVFILGLVAAAYSSADSALTALTTSFCVDFLGFKMEEDTAPTQIRYWVHVGFSILLFGVIVLFWIINDQSVIVSLFKAAGYTYGPLLGLYAFGLFTRRGVQDAWVPIICVLAPLLTAVLNSYSTVLLWGYKFGFELLLLNGALTFLGLLAISKPNDREQTEAILDD